jgi:CMP-N,N'-diacetyllegionaminic acid synthase
MKVLGVIPARGGSKRVPGKNIKELAGKPLINYTIAAAQGSELLFDFIVTTDDEGIANTAKEAGAKVPFLRPAELSGDKVGDKPVLEHALEWYEANHGEIDAICLLRPTSPFKTSSIIDEAIAMLEANGCDSIRTMTKVEGVHHPYWMYKDVDGVASGVIDGISVQEYYQSQLLPPVFRLNGVVDVMKKETLISSDNIYGDSTKILEITEQQSMDIDTPEDFEYCEWLMRKN